MQEKFVTIRVNDVDIRFTGQVVIRASESGQISIEGVTEDTSLSIFSQPASGLLVTGNIKKLTLLGICEQVAVAGDVGKIATMTSDVVVNGKVQTVFSQSGTVTADSIGTVNTLHGTVTPK